MDICIFLLFQEFCYQRFENYKGLEKNKMFCNLCVWGMNIMFCFNVKILKVVVENRKKYLLKNIRLCLNLYYYYRQIN